MSDTGSNPASRASSPPATPVTGLLLRLVWMVFGNIGLIGVAGVLMRDDGGSVGPVSAAYWGLVAFIVGARFVDIRHYGGRTSEGEPATMAHFQRHAVTLGLVAAVVYGVALAV